MDPLALVADGLARHGWPRRVQRAAAGRRPPGAALATARMPRVVLCLAGAGVWRCPGHPRGQVALAAGDALVLPAGAWVGHVSGHAYTSLGLLPARGGVVGWARRMRRGGGAEPDSLPWSWSRPAGDELVATLFRQFDQDDGGADPLLAELTLRHAVGLLLARLAAPLPAAFHAGPGAELLAWLETHWRHGPARAEAARAVGVSPGHVARLLRARTGLGWAQWLDHRRLDAARDLLPEHRGDLGALARACGLGDATYLIRRWRRRWGTTPGAERGDLRRSGQLP